MDKDQKFALLGTSLWHGQPKPGVDRSYDYLKLVGFWEELAQKYGNFENFGTLPKSEAPQIYEELFHKTTEFIQKGYRPLLLGGDHSQAFATVSALINAYPDLRILWVDAHADINTPETSPSGNSHGMPLSGLLGLVDKNTWEMPWMNQELKPHQVVQVGIRDADQGELKLLHQHNIQYYSPESLRQKGLKNLLDELAQEWKNHPTHLSFDIDGLDQSLVPATGTPVPDGLSMEEAELVIQSVKSDFNLVACEIVEFNPDLAKTPDELHTTETHVKALFHELLR